MVDVMFELNKQITTIQAELDDPFQVVIDKFLQKSLIIPNSVYFISNSKTIDPQQTVETQMSDIDKQNNIITVLVNSIVKDDKDKEKVIVQSKDIICPKCKESFRFTIDNYKINLLDCIYDHSVSNIKFKDFYKTQEIDISDIIYNTCKFKSKGNSDNYEFYFCLTCKENICSFCRCKPHPR